MKSAFLVLALLVFAVVVTLAVARAQWRVGTASAVARLSAAAPHTTPAAFAPARLDSLPAPVARYLRAVLRDGAPIARRVVIRHEGGFRADSASGTWSPFRSVQHFTAGTPGFVWDAQVRMAPVLDVYVRDELIGGSGAMRARLAALVPVADAAGSPELASGALHRWLAEAAWFPTALLPSAFLSWVAMDDSTASAVASTSRATVKLTFRFGPDSLLREVWTPERSRDVGGVPVPTPWGANYSDWQWRGDVRVPARGEAAWTLPSGRFAYWRGTLAGVTYD